MRQLWGASRALLSSAHSAAAFILEFIFFFMVVCMFVSEVGRLASLASLASLGACSHCQVNMCLHVGIYVCVRGGAPREPHFAHLPWRSSSLSSSYVSSCWYLCLCQRWGASRASRRSPRSALAFIVGKKRRKESNKERMTERKN